MTYFLQGKTAIITGAAGGIGSAIGKLFCAQGAQVMLTDKNHDRLQDLANDLQGQGHNVQIFAGDLCKRLTIANLLSQTIDHFEQIDILINANRRFLTADPLSEDESDGVDTLWQHNVKSVLNTSQAIAKIMCEQNHTQPDPTTPVGNNGHTKRGGVIVNLSSIATQRTHSHLMAYAMACAGIEQMTKALALALAHENIRVNAIAFGSSLSHSLKQALTTSEPLQRHIVQNTPLGYIADAAQIADIVAFLASPAAAFITGQIITADGGRVLSDAVPVPAY